MARVDLKNTFKLGTVSPEDWHLGIHWKHKVYMDKCLPFGLHSFNMVADALQWILQHYSTYFIILEDFFFVGGEGVKVR